MAFGIGGQERREQRTSKEMFESELRQERQQNALAQAGADMPESRDSDLIRWQQSMDQEVEDACMSFRGMEKKNGKWERIKVYKYTEKKDGKNIHHYKKLPKIMNETGLNVFKTRLMPLVSKNLLMSNYDEARILDKLKYGVINFINTLALHYKEYEVEVTNLSMVKRVFQDICEPAHFRALRDGERRFLTSSSRRIEAVTTDGREQEGKKNLIKDLMG